MPNNKQSANSAYNSYWQERSLYRPMGNYTPVPKDYDIGNACFKFSDTMGDWPWSNDPVCILYNEKDGLYYSWVIYRDHESQGFLAGDWMEMVSKDCINWRQTEKRLEAGIHAKSILYNNQMSFMGGSVWIDKNNRFGYGAGAALFLISMTPCAIGPSKYITDPQNGWIQSVALFVAPDGLGTSIDTSKSTFVFNMPQSESDWRDTRLQWDEDNNQLLFVISNHQYIQFYTNKSDDIKDFKLVQTFDTGYKMGVECPDFHPIIDSVTGEKHWLLTYSKQTPGGGTVTPQVESPWHLGHWDGTNFTSLKRGNLDYGHDFYAQSVSSPMQDDAPETLVMRGYIGNWGYVPSPNSPQKGFVGGCWEDREIYVANGIAKVRPLIDVSDLSVRSTPPSKNAPTWIKAALARTGEHARYILKWDSGNNIVLDISSAIRFDTTQSGKFVWPGKSIAPMPINSEARTDDADIDIFLNGSCLSVYVDGKHACFQIYPEGHFLGLSWVNGAKSISHIKYYDATPLFS